jgi:hypothetical protein
MLYPTYIALTTAATVLTGALSLFGWRFRVGTPGAFPFVLMMAFSATWNFSIIPFLFFDDLPTKVFWTKVEYIGRCWRW